MRREITPDPVPPTPLDDRPTEELGPPDYESTLDAAICGATPDHGVRALCDLPPGHDGVHMFNAELAEQLGADWYEGQSEGRPVDLGDGDLAGDTPKVEATPGT
jgi:hypothetical protein